MQYFNFVNVSYVAKKTIKKKETDINYSVVFLLII